jgi:hypothetical protein
MENTVTVMGGRVELIDEIASTGDELRGYLTTQFKMWLEDNDFRDALSGHLLPNTASEARLPLLLDRV